MKRQGGDEGGGLRPGLFGDGNAEWKDGFGAPQPKLLRADAAHSQLQVRQPPSAYSTFAPSHAKPSPFDAPPRPKKINDTMDQVVVLPSEKKLVLREFKKIYLFCHSGHVKDLFTLFDLLKSTEAAAKRNGIDSERLSSLDDLRQSLLEHMLIWATFADQLAAAFEKDHRLLNEIYRYLVNRLNELYKRDSSFVKEYQICLRILVVGWDVFCRSTKQ